MAAETPDTKQHGFTIDGEIYPEPESLTIDDHRIIKRYTGYNFRDLAGMSPDALYVDQDGIAAILHVSYRHVHQDKSFDEIAEIVGRQNLDEAQASLESASEGEQGDDPLGEQSTQTPDESSKRSTDSNKSETISPSKPSGDDSTTSSDRSGDPPATTTTPESDTSSVSDQVTAAASAS